jgi:LysM repeat protein
MVAYRVSWSLALALALAGCSVFHSHRPAQEPAAAPSQEAPAAAPQEEPTATEAATSSEAAQTAAQTSPAPEESASIVNPSAPKSYTVKRGDTLWGIASLFLKDPWLWPEVWYNNPKIENPHLIYPGDVLTLAYTGPNGAPEIRLERGEAGAAARLHPRLRSTPLEAPIPTIAYSDIAGFLSKPAVLTDEDIRRAPHIVAFRDSHVIAGAGNDVYVRGLKDAQPNARYNVMHIGDPIRDPESHKTLGFQGIYAGTVVLTKSGDPAKAQLTESEREVLEGDRLFALDTQTPLSFELKAPASNIEGQIISVINGVQLIGQYQIVAINRGAKHGLAPGNILAVDQAGPVVRDRYGSGPGKLHVPRAFASRVHLPNERAGMLLVFKTYDRVSFGLIVGASAPMKVEDVVHTP